MGHLTRTQTLCLVGSWACPRIKKTYQYFLKRTSPLEHFCVRRELLFPCPVLLSELSTSLTSVSKIQQDTFPSYYLGRRQGPVQLFLSFWPFAVQLHLSVRKLTSHQQFHTRIECRKLSGNNYFGFDFGLTMLTAV